VDSVVQCAVKDVDTVVVHVARVVYHAARCVLFRLISQRRYVDVCGVRHAVSYGNGEIVSGAVVRYCNIVIMHVFEGSHRNSITIMVGLATMHLDHPIIGLHVR